MEKVLAGLAIKEIANKSGPLISNKSNNSIYMQYGSWSVGAAVLGLLGHTTYLKQKYEKQSLYYQYRNRDYLWGPLKLYCPVILNQLLVSFCQNQPEALLLSFSSLIYLYHYFMDIPHVQWISAIFTVLACVLKFQK